MCQSYHIIKDFSLQLPVALEKDAHNTVSCYTILRSSCSHFASRIIPSNARSSKCVMPWRANDRGSKYTLFFLPTILPVILVRAWEESVGTIWAGVTRAEKKKCETGSSWRATQEREREKGEGRKKRERERWRREERKEDETEKGRDGKNGSNYYKLPWSLVGDLSDYNSTPTHVTSRKMGHFPRIMTAGRLIESASRLCREISQSPAA